MHENELGDFRNLVDLTGVYSLNSNEIHMPLLLLLMLLFLIGVPRQ